MRIFLVVESHSVDQKNEILNQVDMILEKSNSAYVDVKTEWRCLKKFEQLGTYVPPQEYLLGERQEFSNKNGVQVLKLLPVTAQFIPAFDMF